MLASTPTPTERPTNRVHKYVSRLQAAIREGAVRPVASTLPSSAPKPSALKTEQDTRSGADAQAVNWTSLKLEDNDEHRAHTRAVDAVHEVIDLCDSDEDEDQSVEVVRVRAPPQGTAPKMATAVVHHSEYTHSLKRKEREDDDEDLTHKRPFEASDDVLEVRDDVLEVRDDADEEAQRVDIVPAGNPQGTAAKVAAAEAHHSENSRNLKVRIKMSKMTSAAVHPWANSDSPK
ncbi:hypothetical protein CALVIDRAFT_575693, partial [Calocera viscosa TUFC12733]